MRKTPMVSARGRMPLTKRAAVVAAATRKRDEIAAEKQFINMITAARNMRHRQLRQAIKMALAARKSEVPVTKRDERYAKNRERAVVELKKVENERAKAAIKARKEAGAAQAASAAAEAMKIWRAKKKVEREVRAAREKANEEAATERFFRMLHKLQAKRDARVRALLEKKSAANQSTAVEAAKLELEKVEAATTLVSPAESVTEVAEVAGMTPKAKLHRSAKATKTPKKAAVKKEIAGARVKPAAESPSPPPPRVDDAVRTEAAMPEEASQPVISLKATAQRRPRRPPPLPRPATATAAVTAEVAELHNEFVAQLDKAKGQAAARSTLVMGTPPPKTAVPPAMSWVMPESSTGLFRL